MDENILKVQNLTHYFRLGNHHTLKALDHVSFEIKKGEIFGLVGESGSGKSTAARCVMNLYRPTAGEISYCGISTCDPREYRRHRKFLQSSRQIVFQDSGSSLNHHMRVQDIITEPLKIHHIKPQRGSMEEEAAFQLHYVGLDLSYLKKFPPELSGGMRQRVSIARALSMNPRLLVADEPIASLDVSIQAQIINLFAHCNREHGCSILFIAHDLAVVRYLCHRVGVMYQGKLVEIAPTETIFENPAHPYTQSLLSAIPIPDPRLERQRIWTPYDPDSFSLEGELIQIEEDHFVRKTGSL